MLGVNGRGISRIIFTPIAKLLNNAGITPDIVTIFGTIITAIVSLTFLPNGKLILSAVLLVVFSIFDSIDGTLARMSGKANRWGAFLDATCDRFSDFFILFGLAIYCYKQSEIFSVIMCILCMPVFFCISYTRAKAESLKLKGDGGFLERSDRLFALLIIVLAAGFGASFVIFNIIIIMLFLGCIFTIFQRIHNVFIQNNKGVQIDFANQINKPIDRIKR